MTNGAFIGIFYIMTVAAQALFGQQPVVGLIALCRTGVTIGAFKVLMKLMIEDYVIVVTGGETGSD